MNNPIPGLYYIPDAVGPDHLAEVNEALQNETRWFSVGGGKNSRKVMHYGYKYNYGGGIHTNPAPALPDAFTHLRLGLISTLEDITRDPMSALTAESVSKEKFDQCIVNKYLPGQGIGAHIDSHAYGAIVASYTFSSGAFMEFTGACDNNKYTREEIWTEPNSLYIMTGKARYEYKHAMVGRLTDKIPGNGKPSVIVNRGERISITFRSVL